MRYIASNIVIALLAPAALAAQAPAPIARFTVAGGTLTDGLGVRANAVSATPVVILSPSSELAIVLSASGTRFSTGSWAAGGGAGFVVRSAITPFATLAIDAGSGATVTSYRARYLSSQGVPALELHAGPVTVSGGMHAAYGLAQQQAGGPAPTPIGSNPGTTSATRTALGPVVAARAVLPLAHIATLTIGAREQRDRIGSVTVTDRVGSTSLVAGPLTLAGWLGTRRASDEQSTIAGARAELSLTSMVAITAAAEWYPSNRVLNIAGGRSISAGLVLHTATTP